MVKSKLNLAKDIILTIAMTGGVLLVAFAAPGILQAFAPLTKKYSRRAFHPSYMKRRLNSLKTQGLIRMNNKEDGVQISLTQTGQQRVLEYSINDLKIKKQSPWDGKWRYLFFDIPEKRRGARNAFRSKIKELGFERIQQSVWRHKYPCRKEVELLTDFYRIDRYVSLVEGGALA